MRTIRQNTFETNSSSTHTITISSKRESSNTDQKLFEVTPEGHKVIYLENTGDTKYNVFNRFIASDEPSKIVLFWQHLKVANDGYFEQASERKELRERLEDWATKKGYILNQWKSDKTGEPRFWFSCPDDAYGWSDDVFSRIYSDDEQDYEELLNEIIALIENPDTVLLEYDEEY